MSKIRILSEHLANQIAAGEVVERPSSVVKELVENSLDAGADRISVQVEGGGTRLIRVVDNGGGMGGDDVLLSIERHATSKLRDDTGLDDITTLGFRGEALPSIGSVSRLTLLSRPADSPTGTRAEIRFGTLHGVHEAGCARGTIVEVRNLFGNVPARKKFLKSVRTELYHIEEVLRNQSLAHPRTALSLQVDGRVGLELPGRSSLADRVLDVFSGREIWLAINSPAAEPGGPALRGYLLRPGTGSARSSRLRILVNGRPVRDRMIHHAVVEGLRGFLMKGQAPAGVLVLEVAPGQVDVNVHPAKQEIRFRRASEIHRAIVQAVSAALAAHQEEVRSDIFTVESPGARESDRHPQYGFQAVETGEPEPGSPVGGPSRARTHELRPEPGALFPRKSPVTPAPALSPQQRDDEPVRDVSRTPPESAAEYGSLRVIGQFADLYILCEQEGALVVIDQHAAHERILYQQLVRGYMQRDVPSQALLFPLTLELDRRRAETMEEQGEELALLGFGMDHFGDTTWVVKEVPALIAGVDVRELVLETLDRLADGSGREQTGALPSRIEHLLATMACKAAVRAGNRLAPAEILALLARMDESDVFSHCPHGRPVVRIFSRTEIARWFKRI